MVCVIAVVFLLWIHILFLTQLYPADRLVTPIRGFIFIVKIPSQKFYPWARNFVSLAEHVVKLVWTLKMVVYTLSSSMVLSGMSGSLSWVILAQIGVPCSLELDYFCCYFCIYASFTYLCVFGLLLSQLICYIIGIALFCIRVQPFPDVLVLTISSQQGQIGFPK